MRLDLQMNEFLLASRSLFNTHFCLRQPWDDPHRAWDLRDLFEPVEEALFRALVLQPFALTGPTFGTGPQPVRVIGNTGGELPIMINREIDSGYWDYPVTRCHGDADLRFVKFFDWSSIDRKDNRYAMVKIESWPDRPELVSKRALIESHYCSYAELPREISPGPLV